MGWLMAGITKLSSREFNQDAGRAKKAAQRGPVIITDRDRPTHVLLSFEEYRRITGRKRNILEMLAMPELAAIEFDPPRLGGEAHVPAEFQ